MKHFIGYYFLFEGATNLHKPVCLGSGPGPGPGPALVQVSVSVLGEIQSEQMCGLKVVALNENLNEPKLR